MPEELRILSKRGGVLYDIDNIGIGTPFHMEIQKCKITAQIVPAGEIVSAVGAGPDIGGNTGN